MQVEIEFTNFNDRGEAIEMVVRETDKQDRIFGGTPEAIRERRLFYAKRVYEQGP